mmetsp:Transcript_12835/g.22635  ORF Transcript_12835/g.22635 Transcript_12835/m.22635 type:complete len:387 (+) Transcript_12835:239-1399(+)
MAATQLWFTMHSSLASRSPRRNGLTGCGLARRKKLMNEAQMDEDDEVKQLHKFFSTCAAEEIPLPGQDVSALAWLKSKGATEKMLAVAEACHANDFSGPLGDIGLREMIHEDRRWDFGETYLQMDRPMGALTAAMSQGVAVRTSCPVMHVDYASEGPAPVTLTCQDGRKIRCRAVVITVPLPILQERVMSFSPQLPRAKQDAISRIKMGNVIKIILSFSERFWPEDMYDVVCTDSFVPEFWMLHYPHTDHSAGLGKYTVVGFVAGAQVGLIQDKPHAELVRRFTEQLDDIYGSATSHKPASLHLVKSHVIDWAKEPWVRGAYTYPSLNAEAHDREALAAPVADCLFFAGEACNTDLNPCVHGAMDSAQVATVSLLLALQPPSRARL